MAKQTKKVVPLKKPTAKKPAAKKATTKKSAPKKTTKAQSKTSDLKSSNKVKAFLEGKQTNVEAAADKEHNSKLDLMDKLLGYHQELLDIQKSITELTGKKGSKVKTILQVEDWNRGAYSDIEKILRMSEAKRADYLRTFHALFDILYEARWKSELHDLLTQLDVEANPEADLSEENGDEPAFEKVDVLAETAGEVEKPSKKLAEQPEGDPEIAEEAEAFEASADELEKQLAEE